MTFAINQNSAELQLVCRVLLLVKSQNLPILSLLLTPHSTMSETSSFPPHKIIGVAVIWNDQKQILIDRRRPEGAMGGLWEFPGGKIEPGETIQECIQREISEELGIVIEVGKHLITIDHSYTNLRVTLTVHHCRHLTGVPQPLESDEIRWVSLEELEHFTFPKANTQIIAALKVTKD